MNEEHTCINKDVELWREKQNDYYSPSIHVTANGGIGINVGGHVIVKSLRSWHELARKELEETAMVADGVLIGYGTGGKDNENLGEIRVCVKDQVVLDLVHNKDIATGEIKGKVTLRFHGPKNDRKVMDEDSSD